MMDTFKVSSKSIRYIPRSVNLEKFNVTKAHTPGKSYFMVSIVGRITPLKGHTYFIQSMAKVIRHIPHVKIQIIGDAPAKKESYRQELELLVARLGLKDKVDFLGNRGDVPQLLAQSDVLVLSTVTQEAFGRVILEAQAIGVPVVATHVGGVVDIIDDEQTGLLVMPKDTDAMAKAVIRLLQDKALVERLTKTAKQKLLNNFTLEHMAAKTIQVYEELLSLMDILVIKISSVGDVILVTASLRALRKKFSKARIFCLVGRESRKILVNCPYLDGLIIYDDSYKGWFKLWRLARKLQKYRFDKAIDFQNNRKSHLLSFLSLARETYGFNNNKWGGLLTHPVRNLFTDMAPVPHQFQILNKLAVNMDEDSYLEVWPTQEDESYIDELFNAEWLGNVKNIVGINMAASSKWKTKNWPIEHIARLCDMLAAKNIRVIITGMNKDKYLARYLLTLTKSKPAIFVGKTDILQLAALIKRCKVFITPDSAPMHVAAAVKTPFIVFFGPTDPARHIPPAKAFVVLNKKLSCSPCYSSRCRILTHACMKEITPDQVMKEIEHLLGQRV